MGPVVLDTSVVIAVTSPSDPHHRDAAQEFASLRKAGREFRLSTISIAELHSFKGPGRKGRIETANRFVDTLGASAVVDVDRAIAERAGSVRKSRPALHLADALIKATADHIGGELLTADRRLARLEGVKLLGAKP